MFGSPSARLATMFAATAVMISASASIATAQVTWDWGGGSIAGGSGKEMVSFPASAGKPGDVIVSFGDRKLYFITRPGEAIEIGRAHV